MQPRQYIEVRFQVVGYHNWPDAPDDVDFLRGRHRHTFHFRIRMLVEHGNRALEFITVRNRLEWTVRSLDGDFGSRSCEQLAEWLYGRSNYSHSITEIGVSEDGEFEGILKWE